MKCLFSRDDAGRYAKDMFRVVCTDPDSGKTVGSITAWRREAAPRTREAILTMTVTDSGVSPKVRRRGIGTQLYQEAARVACDDYGLPLASDRSTSRSRSAEGFWKKQGKKKRARCVGDSGSKRCETWVLSCPAPVDLSGRRR